MKEKIKKYPFSTLCITVVWVLCLMPVPETPLNDISMIDKWTHLVMWGGTCGTIWVEYIRNHRGKAFSWRKLFLWAWFAPALMSGVIELAQAYCTFGMRSGDWFDFLANTLGCTLAALPFILYTKFFLNTKTQRSQSFF